MSKEGGDVGQDRQVELWKVKKLIKSLQQARGLVFKECFIFYFLFHEADICNNVKLRSYLTCLEFLFDNDSIQGWNKHDFSSYSSKRSGFKNC